MDSKTKDTCFSDDNNMRQILLKVYDALCEKGYNPVDQIVGYIVSEDPTYITNQGNARKLIRKIDRYVLLQDMLQHYLSK